MKLSHQLIKYAIKGVIAVYCVLLMIVDLVVV